MAQLLISPEYEFFPDRHRWTVAECYQMAEQGFLIGRYEVIDGMVVNKMGQKPAHSMCIGLLAEWLSRVYGISQIRVQVPISLEGAEGEYNEPEPDIAVTTQPVTAYGKRHPMPEDLLLIVEVADSSLVTDLFVKAKLYGKAGVNEFWVVDLNNRKVHVHTEPNTNGYARVEVRSEFELVKTPTAPEVVTVVGALLPPAD